MAQLVRAACLTHYVEVAHAAGLDPKSMLRKARLPLACLDQPNRRIAVSSVRRLLESSAIAAGIDDFGLQMAERGGLANLGPVALLVREQATIGAAIDALARFIHIHHEAVQLSIERKDETVAIEIFLRGHPRAARQSIEMVVGTSHRIIRSLLGGHWRPLGVHFVHSAPRSPNYHRSLFGCTVTFNSTFDGIICAASDMDRPIPTADPQLARYVQSGVEAIGLRQERWDAKVAELVRSLLPSRHCTIDRVAEHLSCTRRTIHRHLAEIGTSFSAIVEAERTDLAMRLIEDSDRPLSGIAELLGFSAQSAMARWFRARFGCSISQWRRGVRPAR
jgi:AraC-like DNA-binding protein